MGAESPDRPAFHSYDTLAIGAALISDRAARELVDRCSETDIRFRVGRVAFRCIRSILERGGAVDIATAQSEMEAGGDYEPDYIRRYLAEAFESVPTAAHQSYYIQMLLQASYVSRVADAAERIKGKAKETAPGGAMDLLHFVEAEALALAYIPGSDRGSLVSIKDASTSVIKRVSEGWKSGTRKRGLPSGLAALDRVTGGFNPGDLVIVAARPGVGKTSLALTAAMEACKSGPVVIFSLEMSASQLAARLTASESGISFPDIESGRLSQDQKREVAGAFRKISALPIVIDEGSMSDMHRVRSVALEEKRTAPPVLVVVDYIQLMQSRTDNRVQAISEITRSLKSLARDLACPVLALSQVSRAVEKRDDRRPQLSDLRDSGSIEADADVVLMIYREDYYKQGQPLSVVSEAEIIVAKHRSGPTGVAHVGFIRHLAKFVNREVA